MRKVELAAVRCKGWTWESLAEALAPALEPIGLTAGDGDVRVELLDRGDAGRVLIFEDPELARRAGLALSTRTKQLVDIYEVVATSGGKQFRFRPSAWKATSAGELKSAEGVELNLEEGWTGDLFEQACQVLDAYAGFDFGAAKHEVRQFKRRKAGKASTPRLQALLDSLQKAKSHEFVPQEEGRVELRIELAAGGKQRSFCSSAEAEELKKLLG